MKELLKSPLIIAFCLSFLVAEANALITLNDERGTLQLENNLDTWKYHKNFLGLPHVFIFSEERKEGKSSLSITITGKKINLKAKDLYANQNEYEAGRKKWALKRAIKPINFISYKNISRKDFEVHFKGWNYQKANGKKFLEKSYFLVGIKGDLVHFKLVMDHRDLKELEKVESFIFSSKSFIRKK